MFRFEQWDEMAYMDTQQLLYVTPTNRSYFKCNVIQTVVCFVHIAITFTSECLQR
jgi:hypothetical protein